MTTSSIINKIISLRVRIETQILTPTGEMSDEEKDERCEINHADSDWIAPERAEQGIDPVTAKSH